MPEIRYPGYREYKRTRTEVNDAMIALLAGSRLAAHTLQLTIGSNATLQTVFPAVEHISRFNLRSDVARNFLDNADVHVATVAVPYALATHEAYVNESLDLLETYGHTLINKGRVVQKDKWGERRLSASNMHEALFETSTHAAPNNLLQVFHCLRELRNSVIHNAGRATTRLSDAIADMDSGARKEWARLNHNAEPEDLTQNGNVRLNADLIFTSFAITSRLGRDVNEALRGVLSRESWSAIAVQDYEVVNHKTKNSSSWRRSALGYIRREYSGLQLSDREIEIAARNCGAWTRKDWE